MSMGKPIWLASVINGHGSDKCEYGAVTGMDRTQNATAIPPAWHATSAARTGVGPRIRFTRPLQYGIIGGQMTSEDYSLAAFERYWRAKTTTAAPAITAVRAFLRRCPASSSDLRTLPLDELAAKWAADPLGRLTTNSIATYRSSAKQALGLFVMDKPQVSICGTELQATTLPAKSEEPTVSAQATLQSTASPEKYNRPPVASPARPARESWSIRLSNRSEVELSGMLSCLSSRDATKLIHILLAYVEEDALPAVRERLLQSFRELDASPPGDHRSLMLHVMWHCDD